MLFVSVPVDVLVVSTLLFDLGAVSGGDPEVASAQPKRRCPGPVGMAPGTDFMPIGGGLQTIARAAIGGAARVSVAGGGAGPGGGVAAM